MGSNQPPDLQATRAAAMRVAQTFLSKGAKQEALEVLTVWASAKNDAEGHKLLAEALRHGPDSPLAKAAFAYMEGLQDANQAALDAARVKWTSDALVLYLAEEAKKPSTGWQTELGYNNNVRYRNQVFHIQTEDSGIKRPHIITHLFADGGRILKSSKRSYAHLLGSENLAEQVRAIMKGQHKEMFVALREGKYDDIIDGKSPGGMEVFEHPPNTDARRQRVLTGPNLGTAALSSKPDPSVPSSAALSSLSSPSTFPAKTSSPPSKAPPALDASAAAPAAAVPRAEPSRSVSPPKNAAPVRARLHVIRAFGGEQAPILHELRDTSAILGREGDVAVHDPFVSGRHTFFSFRDGKLFMEEASSLNGTFLRIRGPVELEFGDVFVAGDQLLRVEKNPPINDGPDESPTYFYSSPKWPTHFRVVQLWEGSLPGACWMARTNAVQIGRTGCDLNFPHDVWLSDAHCIVEDQGGFLMLTDFGSKAGTFVRLKSPIRLITGDEILVGRTRLRVELV